MYEHKNAPLVYEHKTAPLVYEHKTAPLVYEHKTAPLVYEHKTAPLVYEHKNAPRCDTPKDLLPNLAHRAQTGALGLAVGEVDGTAGHSAARRPWGVRGVAEVVCPRVDDNRPANDRKVPIEGNLRVLNLRKRKGN